MNEENFKILVQKAEDNKLTDEEKLALIKELDFRLQETNKILKKALTENPE